MQSSARLAVGGEFALTVSDFNRIAEMLYADAGLSLPESKATLVYSRLGKRLRALGMENFRAYCDLVAGSEGKEERRQMLTALTTNVTRFFREPHHFEHLKTHVLPELLRRAAQRQRVRLWSSACSTGPEPYSIALTLLSLLPNAADYDIRILATDIDPKVVETAREGVYSKSDVAPVPADLCRRWMEQDGEDFSAGEAMRKLIAFRELNLIGNWPMKGKFDVIFCRNVVIYFDEETQKKVWLKFRNVMTPEGRLYVGHSERVGIDGFRSDGLTVYALQRAGK